MKERAQLERGHAARTAAVDLGGKQMSDDKTAGEYKLEFRRLVHKRARTQLERGHNARAATPAFRRQANGG